MRLKESQELVSKIVGSEVCFHNLGIEEKVKNYNLIDYPELYNFAHNDKQITNILALLSNLKMNGKVDDADIANYIASLLTHKTHYGFLCELLSLSYLQRNNVTFDVEVSVDEENVLSKSTVSLDGYIEEIDTFFDVKGFGIQEYAKSTFARHVEKYFPGSSVLINGSYDGSYEDVERFAFRNKAKVINDLRETGRSFIDELQWDIRVSNEKVRSSIGKMNPYREAEENKNFIFRKCSQFTTGSPFLLICTFDNQFNCNLVLNFTSHTDIMTRSLARRAFVEFKQLQELAKNIDSKCKSDVTLSQASKSLSGILFIDAYNDKSWLYLNPNAYHKLDRHKLERAFDFQFPYEMHIDDFENDNY